MRHTLKAFAALLALCPIQQVNAALIERTLNYTLGPINGSFGDGQTLMGVGTFFADDPFVIGVGDTLIFNILFDSRLQVFDFREATDEYFSFGLNTVPGSPGFGGTWTSSIEALGARGDIWAGAITLGWMGGGAGFGWGGQGINITGSQGSFTGIRWTTTITSAREGSPMTIYAFTGVQMGADGIKVVPANIPEPGTLALLGLGLAGLGISRRRKA